jgi:hypothetical protein
MILISFQQRKRRDGRERDSSKKYYWNISVKGRLIRKEGVAGFLFMAWCAAAYYIYTIPDAVQHGSVGIRICTSLLNFHTLAATIFFLDETTLHLLPIIVYTNNIHVENSGAVE